VDIRTHLALRSSCGLPAEAGLMYYKSLTRFNYWDYPSINPLLLHCLDGTPELVVDYDAGAHRDLSAQFQGAYAAGDLQAIFVYVRADVWAFRSPWVVQQIEQWRQENTDASRALLHKLMTSYAGEGSGKRRLSTIHASIKKDQEIFKEVIRLNQLQKPPKPLRSNDNETGCFEAVAESCFSNVDDVERIYKHYKRKIDNLMGRLTGKDRKILRLAQEKGMIPPNQDLTPPPRQLASWEEAFRWLDDMAAAIERSVGVEK
jgi:hypothetical protein